MKHFYLSRVFFAALLAGLFMTQSAHAQHKEYTDGVLLLLGRVTLKHKQAGKKKKKKDT